MTGLRDWFKNNSCSEKDILQVKINHYGVLNPKRVIYFIAEDNKDLGFFAMYRYWIEYLYFADICDYLPVIRSGPNFPYQEKGKVNGTNNPFEYYFIQPASVSVQNAKISRNVVNADAVHRQMVELILTGKHSNYKVNKRYMSMMAYIVNKYMRFNEITWEYISNGLKELNIVGEKILGVHIRGTDFRSGYYNHPVYVKEQEYFNEIDSLLDRKQYSKIFIATDDLRILYNFRQKYGNRVCFYDDIKRNNKNQSVAFSKDERSNHNYLLGLEVIRDMYTLSMCWDLVAGVSQVAICARINKMARTENSEDLKIIDNGLNENNHIFMRY